MRKEDVILILGILTSIALLSIFHTKTSIGIYEEALRAETIEKNSLVVLDKDMEYFVKKYITKNGLELEIGNVTNRGESKKTEVYINARYGIWITFNPYIKANESWTYAKIGGFLILPESSGLIILPENTTYYKINKQLRLHFSGSGERLFIYSQKRPTSVFSSTNVFWSYDSKKEMIEIYLKDVNGNIVVDWTEYPVYDILFVEDRTKEEELLYELSLLEDQLNKIKEEHETTLNEIESTKNKIAELDEKIGEKKKEKAELEANINQKENEKRELIKKIEENFLISPLNIQIFALMFVVLIVLIIILRRGGEKNEE
jgi:hypothetical protein